MDTAKPDPKPASPRFVAHRAQDSAVKPVAPPKSEAPKAEASQSPAAKPEDAKPASDQPKEAGGPKGLEPTRFGDWERDGRCVDF